MFWTGRLTRSGWSALVAVAAVLGGEPREDGAELLRVGLGLDRAILGAAHLRSGDELQRVGDLRRVLDAGDAALELADRRHRLVPSPILAAATRPDCEAGTRPALDRTS